MGKSIKISTELYKKLKVVAHRENRFIGTLLNKAVENYLRAKKVLPLVCMTNKE
jgi:predicted DNA-binding protein